MTRSACLNAIYELAKVDNRVIFIGSDLAPNTMADFKRDFPDRWFMEGVQEQNIVGMAAGLAMEGYIPYVNTIASFLTRRCYEQIAVDICMHNLPVRLIGNGGGLVYAPLGPTHCSQDDITIMRAIPNMSVVCCSDNEEMKEFMPSTLTHKGPIYIRLGKDSDPVVPRDWPSPHPGKSLITWKIAIGQSCFIAKNLSAAPIKMFGTGRMTDILLKTSAILESQGILAEVYHVPVVKPLSCDGVLNTEAYILNPELIVTAEEGIIDGGLGTAILEHLSGCIRSKLPPLRTLRFGLPDAFPHHYGEQADLLETYGLTPEKMAEKIKRVYDAL